MLWYVMIGHVVCVLWVVCACCVSACIVCLCFACSLVCVILCSRVVSVLLRVFVCCFVFRVWLCVSGDGVRECGKTKNWHILAQDLTFVQAFSVVLHLDACRCLMESWYPAFVGLRSQLDAWYCGCSGKRGNKSELAWREPCRVCGRAKLAKVASAALSRGRPPCSIVEPLSKCEATAWEEAQCCLTALQQVEAEAPRWASLEPANNAVGTQNPQSRSGIECIPQATQSGG